jgi:hypothetical protein
MWDREVVTKPGTKTRQPKRAMAELKQVQIQTAVLPSGAPGALLRMQREYGNRYVRRVVELARKGQGEGDVIQAQPDLYRSGNAGGPRIDHVREGKDITPDANGDVHPLQGGVSSFAIRKTAPKWWKFPANTAAPAGIAIRNDHGSHWSWEPAQVMPLGNFINALGQSAPNWVKWDQAGF